MQTAEALSLPVIILPGLRELCFGEWDGLTFDRIRQHYPELYAARAQDQTILPPDSEEPDAALTRFGAAMREAAATASGDFAVVAHGGIIARFLRSIGGVWYKPDYAEVVSLIYDKDHFLLAQELPKLWFVVHI